MSSQFDENILNQDEHPTNILWGFMNKEYIENDEEWEADKWTIWLATSTIGIFCVILFACIICSCGAILLIIGSFIPFAYIDGRNISQGYNGGIYPATIKLSEFYLYFIAGLIIYIYGALRFLLKGYIKYLELHTTFLFNYDNIKQRYALIKYIRWISIITLLCCFMLWFASVIVWSISFMSSFSIFYDNNYKNDDFKSQASAWIDTKLYELTLTNSFQFSTFGLLMLSPVWILFIIFMFVSIIALINISKMRRDNNCVSVSLMSLNNTQNDEKHVYNYCVDEENKKFIYRVLLIHILLLMTWVFWKWFVSPFSSVINGSLLQAVILKAFTISVKHICYKLSDVDSGSKSLIFRSKNIKIIINISISILFAFGLKFVFSNIKIWYKFVLISIVNSIWKLINGSFKSHLFGKRVINKIKLFVNKILSKCCCCCSKRLDLDSLHDMNDEIEYNKWLAFDMSIAFIISASSCLIVMVYFAMNAVLFQYNNKYKIDNRAYVFISISFAIECIVYFLQIATFMKRDKKYFVVPLGQRFEYKTSWTPDTDKYERKFKRCRFVKGRQIEQRERWMSYLSITLVLAWFWIGNLTGQPAVFH